MMRRTILLLVLLVVTGTAAAQTHDEAQSWWNGNAAYAVPIREVSVTTARPMKEIGVRRTAIDSAVLKENIALTMADVLTFNSSVFVKQYGRATLSTVAFRGTSPSHTQVTWNGMKINSPMLGMTDFSMIPSYFIDDAELLHGTSSLGETGGGLGGAVKLATKPAETRGVALQYVQGVGSFRTFDEFLRLTYGNARWQGSTRVVYASSPNNFKYCNHDKKENIYDDEHQIIGQYYPVERNRSGAYHDLHLLQELYYNTLRGDRFSFTGWYVHSNRELPLLTTDYGDESLFENGQRERTLRAIVGWDHLRSDWKVGAKAGYIYSWTGYDYRRDPGNGVLTTMTRSRSRVQTLYGQLTGEYTIGSRWLFTANLTAHQHDVQSRDKSFSPPSTPTADRVILGYNQQRLELSGALSAKWRPVDRFGISALLREESYGTRWTPLIPALFVDGVLSRRGNVVVKASLSRNYRAPSLNDLYFMPGGNPDLRSERGISYDVGLSFALARDEKYSLGSSLTWFDSRVSDWILWLPTTKGFFSPVNVKDVHAYGVEFQVDARVNLGGDWRLQTNATAAWTPSRNCGEKMSAADISVGKQLPYVPEYSATLTARLSWRSWSLLYKWCYYSERYTMSSNAHTLTGQLPPYFMNNITLEKSFSLSWANLSLKGVVNNLFNEEYLSVLSRPMPGINYEVFLSITPKW